MEYEVELEETRRIIECNAKNVDMFMYKHSLVDRSEVNHANACAIQTLSFVRHQLEEHCNGARSVAVGVHRSYFRLLESIGDFKCLRV